MLVQKKIGTLDNFPLDGRRIDLVLLEWYETNKRILHKPTQSGRELIIRFLNDRPRLSENDILFEDAESVVSISILPCEAIVVRPVSVHQLASLCYEIGNKHLPLFMEGEEILIPFEEPVFRLLKAGSYAPEKAMRKLLFPLQSTVQPHEHNSGPGLLSRILKLTSQNGNG